MATQTLSIPASWGGTISIQFDIIENNFGGGFDDHELVGPSDGTMLFRVPYDHLPAGNSLLINDPENSNTPTPWAAYLWKFYKRRMQDLEAFNITALDPETNTTGTWLVKFVNFQLDYNALTWQLYSSGIELRQWRALT